MIGALDRDFLGRRILVVEDEWLIALDVRDILEAWGFIVLGPVATTKAALEMIADECPDVAILDVRLDGETSESVADALRAHRRPFVVLTAYQRSHLTGPLADAALLSKPFDENKLRKQLAALLPDKDHRGTSD